MVPPMGESYIQTLTIEPVNTYINPALKDLRLLERAKRIRLVSEWIRETINHTCYKCDGSGKLLFGLCKCSICNGSGHIVNDISGFITKTKYKSRIRYIK